jgi:RimJ/RimL family protein N-acetyltransferase
MNGSSAKRSGSFVLRDADENDAKAIKDIINSVASEKRYISPESSREDWDKTIREIKDRKGRIIVSEVDGKTVGMAYLVGGKFENDRHVAFLGITILKGFRRMGIGTAAMKRLVEWAKSQGELEKISLKVFSTNSPAINLYRKFRFEVEGISKRQCKIEGRYVDEITMAKFLR